MARSECFCNLNDRVGFSCESTLQQNIRFRFAKENNCITDRVRLDETEYVSGLTPNDIAHCELKERVCFKDKLGTHEPKNSYCDKGGHKERSEVAQPNHKKHWNKVNKRR